MTRRTFISSLLAALALGPWLLDWRKPKNELYVTPDMANDWERAIAYPYRNRGRISPGSTCPFTYTITYADEFGNEWNPLEDPKCPTS